MRNYLLTVIFLVVIKASCQSLELMPGTKRVFVDVQWLETMGEEGRWSLFSRSRATSDYEEATDLFIGTYLNHTLPAGVGVTAVGRISSLSAGCDVGLHFFKSTKKFLVYALTSTVISQDVNYSWFSIFRYTPPLSENWNLFSGLELFSNFDKRGHIASVQRLRLGLDRNGFQFGLGLNLSGLGRNYKETDSNSGMFIRKQIVK